MWPVGPQKQAVGQGLIMGLYISPVDLNPTDKHSLGGWEEALGGVCVWEGQVAACPEFHPCLGYFPGPFRFLGPLGRFWLQDPSYPSSCQCRRPHHTLPGGHPLEGSHGGSEESSGVESGCGGGQGFTQPWAQKPPHSSAFERSKSHAPFLRMGAMFKHCAQPL